MSRPGAAVSLCFVPLLAFSLPFVLPACASQPEWSADWNRRVDNVPNFISHPCGDFAFDVWAEEFLEGCGDTRLGTGVETAECEQREDWVWARSDQCNVWQEWLLRNHNQRVRDDLTPEPMVKVPGP